MNQTAVTTEGNPPEDPSAIRAHDRLASDDVFAIYGYEIMRHGDHAAFEEIREAFRTEMASRIASFAGVDTADFTLAGYHSFMETKGVDHHGFIQAAKRVLPESFLASAYLKRIVEMCSEKFGAPMSVFTNRIEYRVVRPNIGDNNPMHRDHWFGYFTPLVNLYIPLSGSWHDSAMKVVPRSHLWADDAVKPAFEAGTAKTIKNGVAYSVPEITHSEHEIIPHRPDIIPGDFMAFSPVLVHGGGDNFSHETRFSFEVRLQFDD